MEDLLNPRSLRDVMFGVASDIPAVGMTCRNHLPTRPLPALVGQLVSS